MSSSHIHLQPPDHSHRLRALDTSRSVLVEAPAGSGKTDLLTRRFLRLLAEVDEPGQIVAITFTRAATSEMVNRIVAELEKAAVRAANHEEIDGDEVSMAALAAKALEHSEKRGWNLVELPGQLRVTTIDAFCRELAQRRPLLSGLGGEAEIVDDAREFYRRAARRTLEQIDGADGDLRDALRRLLLWRDNSWQELEDLLVEMLSKRDRWMQEFVFGEEFSWDTLRARLERPFEKAVRGGLEKICELLDQQPDAREEAHSLVQFTCENAEGKFQADLQPLAEMVEFPAPPFHDVEGVEDARRAVESLAKLLLTSGEYRQRVDKRQGFPKEAKAEKDRLQRLIARLRELPEFRTSLVSSCGLPPARYTDDDWMIVRACFVLLRAAAPRLRIAFAEAAVVDFTEVAQIALDALRGEEGLPSDAVLAFADGIRHLLVDEFQDTSRRQHRLLAHLIAAWPEREGRTCFVVGDPKQSIYFFRDADAELFPQVRESGLAIPDDVPFPFDCERLTANFRSARGLVGELNGFFDAVFAQKDGSGVAFADAEAFRADTEPDRAGTRVQLHYEFMPVSPIGRTDVQQRQRIAQERDAALNHGVESVVAVIRERIKGIDAARALGRKMRIAVLGRARAALVPIAEALREAGIPFRAVELEILSDRSEVRDVLSISRALVNPQDRIAWLSLLRAPWCGLALTDLYAVSGGDNQELIKRPIRELMRESVEQLAGQGRAGVERVLRAIDGAESWRAEHPAAMLGTWLRQAWMLLGGAACVNTTERANVELLLRALDSLTEAEQDIAGPALDAALDKLTALPDPGVDSEYGVQLMTIHKAKGLEFEVVIVPELQARGGRSRSELLSWLERGLDAPGEGEEITEFLVAPIQPRGADRGKAKEWVDRERKNREIQEMRRLLYVAATRAREELHLFARPEYKQNKEGGLEIQTPVESLLKTAWPAVEQNVRESFNEWLNDRDARDIQVPSIAAGEGSNVVEMPGRAKQATLCRLPMEFRGDANEGVERSEAIAQEVGATYERHEGGLASRALGVAVHAIFERVAIQTAAQGLDAAIDAITGSVPHSTAEARAMGMDRVQAGRIAAQAGEIAREAMRDPVARWILEPRSEAASEQGWVGVEGGVIRTVRADRVFRAGIEPGSKADDVWWIVDWKTAHAEGIEAAQALPRLRAMFAPQLEVYARVLRGLKGSDAMIRCGLYYPRMKAFDWWEA